MTISDAQFTQWLRSDAPRVVLAEMAFAYESAGNVAEGAVYLGSRGYITGPADTPPNQAYRDAITKMPAFERAIDVNTLGGRSSFSISDLDLANTDGALDFLLDLIVDGREINFYLGAPKDTPGWGRSDFRLVLSAVVERIVAPDEQRILVKLRDKRLLLDREIKGDPVGGSGPNATKYQALLWGSHQNHEPLLYDEAALQYAVLSNYSAGFTAVADVRDSGVSLLSGTLWSTITGAGTTVDAGTDVITHVAHGLAVNDVVWWEFGATYTLPKNFHTAFPGIAARAYWVKTVPDADTFTLSETKGGATLDITGTTFDNIGTTVRFVRARYFDDTENTGRIELSSTPNGRVTCDVYNEPAGYSDVAPFAMALSLIEDYGNVVSGDIDSAAFTAADTALDAKVSLGFCNLAVTDRKNLLEVLDTLIDAAFGWYGVTSTGLITCGLLDPSGLSAATATQELTADAIIGDMACENIAPTVSRTNVQYDLNVVTQTDGLASSLTPEERALYAEPFRKVQRGTAPSGTAYSTNKPLYHKTMVEGAPRTVASMNATALGNNTTLTIDNYADEIVADRAPHLRVLRCAAVIDCYDWELGEVVEATRPRFGLDAGVNCRIVGIAVDLLEPRVDLTLLTQVTPDYTTASYA